MFFLIVGVVLVALKVAGVEHVAELSWWWVLSPFALAALWWWFSDATGLTKKREIDKMEVRKAERRRKHIVNLGMNDDKPRRK